MRLTFAIGVLFLVACGNSVGAGDGGTEGGMDASGDGATDSGGGNEGGGQCPGTRPLITTMCSDPMLICHYPAPMDPMKMITCSCNGMNWVCSS